MPRLLAIAAVPEPGGAEVALLRLLRRLADRGWDVTLTSPARGTLSEAGFRWAALPLGGLRRGAGARALLSFPRARTLAGGADAVLLNGGVAARVLPAVGRARTVLHVWDLVRRVPPHWRRADAVVACSRAAAERLRGLHAEVVGFPVELPPPEVPAPWRHDGAPVVGFVGRIEPRKGPLDLVRAAPLIRAARPDARIVVVGDDPYGTAPGYLEAVRASREVEHHGWAAEAAALMAHLDVLVVPSREEALGGVAAEALAAGTPVVASRVGGLPEVVEDGVTGALVTPGRPTELAAAVVRVRARRDELSAAARARAGRFAAGTYADRIERALRG